MVNTAQASTVKRWILTGGVTIITVAGAYIGANLKTSKEHKTQQRQIMATSTQDRIDILQNQRTRLLGQKAELTKKLEEIKARPGP